MQCSSVQLTQAYIRTYSLAKSVIICNVYVQIRHLQSSSIMLSLVLHSRPPGSVAVTIRILGCSKNLFCNVKALKLASPLALIVILLLPVKLILATL